METYYCQYSISEPAKHDVFPVAWKRAKITSIHRKSIKKKPYIY